ncbi:exodeoxyribonuclease V subunit gamma [Nocardioides sp. ChNu-99]|uniref:exodeoxyribonuclease V subunit gamma n=1 Tax=Nocardioides sp. ChNu-99 TaxID=2839897 RepID=UPI002406D84C|nr:exodeoxyribonuclease V subunit gamma [Nocardioides sp. ChNu-99]MDF9714961.1 exodeoxyribonuclease V subunit gamma [Nocardioides sp. ChNu-99]
MSLTVHRAPRTDLLADALGELLARPVDDPFAEEVVVVPARGVERWLTQRLSHRLGTGPRGGDGVCAGVRFLTPHSLVSVLLGREHDDPWEPGRLAWPVLEAVDAHLDEAWALPLARHLGAVLSPGEPAELGELRRTRRWAVARRLAGAFASYAAQRPALVADWRAGRDTDGAGGVLAEDLRWQAELWRRVVERVDAPAPDERHAATLTALRSGDDGLDLPDRLSLFGHTRLPVAEVELLEALATRREVHLWLPVASPALSARLDLAGGPGGTAGGLAGRTAPRRADADMTAEVGHPLLAALGRDARELQQQLARLDARVEQLGDVPDPPPSAPLLTLLQADVRADRLPTPAQRAERTRAVDTSVQVHACHGPARQVEVLREVLVGLLADDPTLEPRDVLVMCPDVEAYAPLVEAGFGLASGDPDDPLASASDQHPAHRLRVRLADRALSSVNPLLALAERLVALAGSRVTASDVLDLAGRPVVRRRFALDEDDLSRVERWVRDAGVRWGFDAEHRADYGLGHVAQNTWRAGLDRVLLGVAVAGDVPRWVGSALPLDDVGSGDADLAGRFAELVDRLEHGLDRLHGPASAEEWVAAIGEVVTSLAAVPPRDAWQAAELERELRRLAPVGVPGVDRAPLGLPEVRAMLTRAWAGRPTRANFRTGTLTVSTLVPMRSVPHRVVCLLGLDDGVFPRAGITDGDDVLARSPLVGERDPRSEDRQLLLDAVMAATEHLVVTYTGAGEHTGTPRPPAVPLGELLSALERTAVVEQPVLVRHPLQPFHPSNLVVAEDGSGRPPFSFDTAALAGAEAARGPRRAPYPLLAAPLPAVTDEVVSLDDLVRFLVSPAREFLRSRLDVATRFDEDEVADAVPLDLDALEKWGVGSRVLADALAGVAPGDAIEAERRRGQLPPRALGSGVLAQAESDVRRLYAGTLELRAGDPRTVDVDVDLGDGRRLVGTVGGLHGSRLVSVEFSSLRAKHRIAAWVRLLALAAAYPDESFTAHTVGRAGRAGPRRALAGPLDHRALGWLRDLVDVRDRGMREPVPLPVGTACAYAEALHRQRHGDEASLEEVVTRSWVTQRGAQVPGEADAAEHVLLHGPRAGVDVLLGPPRPDETWVPTTEGGGFRTRLGQYAWRVWAPLVEGAEKVGPL